MLRCPDCGSDQITRTLKWLVCKRCYKRGVARTFEARPVADRPVIDRTDVKGLGEIVDGLTPGEVDDIPLGPREPVKGSVVAEQPKPGYSPDPKRRKPAPRPVKVEEI